VAAYIAPVSWGLGDLIVSLPAVQGLIDSGKKTYLVTRSNLQEGLAQRILGLAASIREKEFIPQELSAGDRFYNLREHPLQKNYWWGSQEFERAFGNIKINEILKIICDDFAIPTDFEHLTRLTAKPRRESEGRFIFLPGSDGSYKCWPCAYWMEVRGALKTRGFEVLLLGQPECSDEVAELLEAGLDWVETPTLEDALDVISSARAVIGVDTGLMHMAVHQGIPTMALYRDNPVYIRNYPHVSSLIANSCHPECIKKSLVGRNNQITEFTSFTPKTWTCEFSDKERCMSTIDPARVMNKIESCKYTHA